MDSVTVALHAVTVQRWTSIIAMLSVIAVPLLGSRLLVRWSRGRPFWTGAAIWVSGCSSLLLYGAVAFIFAVCWGGEIGESGKNRLARAYGAPVISALERYHSARGEYPKNLGDLVPEYLSGDQLRASDESVLANPFEYRVDSGSYDLSVQFGGPGMNECHYRPGKAWRCGGYF